MKTTAKPFVDAPLALDMLEISPVAVAILTVTGIVVFVNGRLCNLLGFSREELLGNPVELFLPKIPLRDRVSQPARSLSPSTNRHIKEAGQLETVFANDKEGTGVPVTISLHEITGSQESFLLVHLVRARQESVESHLLESARLAAIAQMVSGLAHESRNALQKAVANLDLLELDLKSNPQQMMLSKRIRESLSDLLENYDEVRLYAQPIAVNPERVNLLHLCDAAFNQITFERDDFHHQLIFSSATEHDHIAFVDREKMKLVFHHLLENAIDAADKTAIIDVGCFKYETQDMLDLKVIVRDHGSGFDAQSLKQAFEPFYTTKQHGTGLGLAICRRIIEAHGGKIKAANHASVGAVIEITLPIRQADRKNIPHPVE